MAVYVLKVIVAVGVGVTTAPHNGWTDTVLPMNEIAPATYSGRVVGVRLV